MKKIVQSSKAPKAVGPYSQAVEAHGFLFVSGQIPMDPESGKIVDGGIREQTGQVLKNIGSLLESAGYDFSHVIKSTCFLSDMANFKAMNEIYASYYKEEQPARSAFAVKELPLGVLVEIETIAAK